MDGEPVGLGESGEVEVLSALMCVFTLLSASPSLSLGGR